MQHRVIFTFLLIPLLIGCSSSPKTTPPGDKQADTSLRLYDIWALDRIEGKAVKMEDLEKHPYIELNLTRMSIMGNDGCNDFSGSITAADKEKLVFGGLKGTTRSCHGIKISDTIKQYLIATQSYKIEELQLFLYDQAGKKLLSFRKVD